MTNPAFQRAMILHQQGRHADAEQEFRQAISQDPRDPTMHAMLSLCLAKQNRFREATEEAQSAIGLGPDLAIAHFALAAVLFDRRRFGEAADAVMQAIRLDGDQADHFALLSAIRFEQRAWPSALEAAEKSLEFFPQHAWATNLRAMALVQLGRKADAASTLGDALSRDPENAVTHANQGWALLHRGEHVKAMEHFREALRLNPNLEWARAGIVEALKARHFIYRWMLQYFLFMSRRGRQAQWGIIIGGYVGYRIALNVAQTNPSLAPWLWPILIAYIIFAILTWLSYPLFNLMLRLHPFGKLALSRDQRVAANWTALLLLLALSPVGLWLYTGNSEVIFAGLPIGILIAPVTAVYLCAPGWPRWTMAGLAGLLALMLFSSLALAIASVVSSPQEETLLGLGMVLLQGFVYGVLISTFAANWLATVKPKR